MGAHVIYGGPYAHESEAIIAESQKKKPNFDKLISGWNTITQGALDAIENVKNPPEPFSGTFSKNVVNVDEEEVPEVSLYITPDEAILPQDAEKDRDNPEKFITVGNIQDQATPYKKNESEKSDDVLDSL